MVILGLDLRTDMVGFFGSFFILVLAVYLLTIVFSLYSLSNILCCLVLACKFLE